MTRNGVSIVYILVRAFNVFRLGGLLAVEIPRIEAVEHPVLLALFCNALLLKQGGQVSFSCEQLANIAKEYSAIRLVFLPDSETYILTLRTSEQEPRDFKEIR